MTIDVTAARRMFAGLPVVAVATVGADGSPHVVPLWFVWSDDDVYVSTRRASRTWRNVASDPRVALTVDVGRAWTELAGIVVEGRAEPLLPDHPSMRKPISAWHEKYRSLLAGEGFSRFAEEIPGLCFIRVVPERLKGWDHARR